MLSGTEGGSVTAQRSARKSTAKVEPDVVGPNSFLGLVSFLVKRPAHPAAYKCAAACGLNWVRTWLRALFKMTVKARSFGVRNCHLLNAGT